MATSSPLRPLVLELLAARERRVLSLTVAVRRALGPFARVNDDLLGAVQSALRGLVASGAVTHVDGMYVLAPPRRPGHRAGPKRAE